MEKRAFLAIVLSLIILLAFQWYLAKHYPQPTMPKPETRPLITSPQPQASPSPTSSLPDEKETLIETDKFKITFTNIGGAIKKIELKDYPDPQTKEPLELFNVIDPRYNIASIKELYIIPNSDLVSYNSSKGDGQISYYYSIGNFSIEKIYKIHNSFNNIDLNVKIKNHTNTEIRTDYNIVAGSSINSSEPPTYRYRDVEISSKTNGNIFKTKKDSTSHGEITWSALKNKYFSIILKPRELGSQLTTKSIDNKKLEIEIKTKQFAIPPQSEINHEYFYYIGPIHVPLLKKYGMGLEETVDYGIFGWISIMLLSLLKFFHNIFNNWGIAIICMTLLINFILYPLSRKSYKSMKQLQELQPHIEKLRQIHKDNPNKLNKEIIELYKKYKVNPLGGCLPIILQMPIILAMYQAIMKSIELKGSSFLWIKDLSQPDALKLPFNLPVVGNSINILPLLMIVAMVFQQKLSPMAKSTVQTQQQKQQQTMMLIMPIMFGIIFYSLPSGLVLYWLMNTLIMVYNQYKIMKVASVVVEG